MPTVHLIIKGKVQGVFFRATAKEKAEGIGVGGWVRNMAEGHVEAIASGTEEQLQTFIAWCKQGPSRSKVTGVELTSRAEEHFNEFRILR